LLDVVELLEDERDVHARLAGPALALAVDTVLADQREGVRQEVKSHGEPAARAPHHRLVMLERVTVLVEH